MIVAAAILAYLAVGVAFQRRFMWIMDQRRSPSYTSLGEIAAGSSLMAALWPVTMFYLTAAPATAERWMRAPRSVRQEQRAAERQRKAEQDRLASERREAEAQVRITALERELSIATEGSTA